MRGIGNLRRRLLASPAFLAAAKRVLPRADVRLYRLSRGTVSLTPRGARVLLLTTVGRRTGRHRTTPLIYTEHGDTYLVVASNWGEPAHPGWLYNLMADPAGWVQLGGRRRPVSARLLAGAERARIWPMLVRSWPLYAELVARAGDRELPVVSLRPADPDATG